MLMYCPFFYLDLRRILFHLSYPIIRVGIGGGVGSGVLVVLGSGTWAGGVSTVMKEDGLKSIV